MGDQGAGEGEEGATTVLSLEIVGDGSTGLTTTDGQAISLYLEGDLVVGRVATGEADAGKAAFAVSLGQDGSVSVAQWLSLNHPTSPDEHDEGVDLSGLVKAAVFGFLVSLMGCYHGYNSRGGAQGVGAATTRAVVSASILILTADYIVTELFFSR